MKRVVVALSLCLGFFCFSCDNQVEKKEVKTIQKENNFSNAKAQEKVELRKAPKKADTIINGRQVFRFGNESPTSKIPQRNVSLDVAIRDFDNNVRNANSCEELMIACKRFDTDVKSIRENNKNIKVTDIESRDDVMKIRKLSEEKSLSLCQTSRITE